MNTQKDCRRNNFESDVQLIFDFTLELYNLSYNFTYAEKNGSHRCDANTNTNAIRLRIT